MSKKHISFPPVLAAFLLILQFVNNSAAQPVDAFIRKVAGSSSVVEIEGFYPKTGPRPDPRNLSFLETYAGVTGLSKRISDLSLFDLNNRSITYKRFMPGEYVADADFQAFRFKINLKPPDPASAAAHVSWLSDDMGILFLRDLLPLTFPGRRFDFELGNVYSARGVSWDGSVETAVFIVGRNLRKKDDLTASPHLSTVISGTWQFRDDDALKLAREIVGQYQKELGPARFDRYQVAIAKFPANVPVDNWEADTRGSSIVILSSDTPFRSQSIQRLHEQLRHEIFHLWIPEGVNLTGSYDWFYEGFALYQSLKVGLAVNRISFDNYLDTLSRAYDMDRHDGHKLSLIEASKQRWNGANTQVYARGMLVAFLCDLALLEHSKGKRSVTDVVGELYRKYRPPAAAEDGNTAVLALLRSHPELIPIVDRNIAGTDTIDWGPLLKAAGLEANAQGRLSVSARPSGAQKDLLDKLGYNNWRKLPRSKQ